MELSRGVVLLWLSLFSCERERAQSEVRSVDVVERALPPRDASVAAVREPGPPVDPGTFQRFGCATDAMPPHIATGTARVLWRPERGEGFHFRNLPARCGGAYPGQLVNGTPSRPGDGAEFVVCMPDERRLDIGILRRGPVPSGVQDLSQLTNVVRLRIVLDRFVNLSGGGPNARLEFGARNRSANGRVSMGASAAGPAAGVLEFEIDCSAGRR